MTLRDYLKTVYSMVRENPDILDLHVVYSSDDDGNNYYPVTGIEGVDLFEDDAIEKFCVN